MLGAFPLPHGVGERWLGEAETERGICRGAIHHKARPALSDGASFFPVVEGRYLKMPHAPRGLAVGLFGGSFNPPHAGHALVAEIALRRLRLDQLWWIVTPGNPLKSGRELTPLAERIRLSEAIARDPRIKVTAFEAAHHVRYTADTLALVKARNPGVDFVWIMGADSLRDFHLWQRWREIVMTFPIAVIDRPGSTLSFLSSAVAKTFDHARRDETDAPRLARMTAPAWTFIHGPRSSLSSTAIRSAAANNNEAAATVAGSSQNSSQSSETD